MDQSMRWQMGYKACTSSCRYSEAFSRSLLCVFITSFFSTSTTCGGARRSSGFRVQGLNLSVYGTHSAIFKC